MVVLPGPPLPEDQLFAIVTLLLIVPVLWGYHFKGGQIIVHAPRVVRLSLVASLVVSLISILLIPVSNAATAIVAIVGLLVLPLLSSIGVLILLGAIARPTGGNLPAAEDLQAPLQLSKWRVAGAFLGTVPGVWVVTLVAFGGPFDVTVWADSPVNAIYIPLSLLVIMLLPPACAFGSLMLTTGKPLVGGLLLLGGATLILVRLAVLLGWASNWSISSLVQNWNSIMDLSRFPFELAFVLALTGVLVVGGLCAIIAWRTA